MGAKNKKKFVYKKLRLSDNYQYSSEEEQEKQDEKTNNLNEFNEQIIKKEADIGKELFKNHFGFRRPSDMFKLLCTTKDKTKNDELVNVINSRIQDLNKEIEKMSEDEKKTQKPDEILKIVEDILNFNKQNQQEKGLKILTPNQMLSRLPITLAQLKAGNNSEKLKNEIRQLLYSLYCSKNMTKQVYNNLLNYI